LGDGGRINTADAIGDWLCGEAGEEEALARYRALRNEGC
jgi:hypothetical protein